jgi:deazaflavin-dependent oxidoreductase (nitroreductase family)
MENHSHKAGIVWKMMRLMTQFTKRVFGRGGGPRGLVCVLTTTGRKSGLPRQTPLQYELIDGQYWLGSARGVYGDWVRNIVVNPKVELMVDRRVMHALAEVVDDPQRVEQFLRIRLQRHPRMIAAMLQAEGLPRKFSDEQFKEFAAQKAAVVLTPFSG